MKNVLSLLLLASAATSVATSDITAVLYAGGPPANAASAPYNAFSSCIRCHADFILNSGDGELTISGMPAQIAPNTTYPLTLTLEDPGQSRWGYELTVCDDNGNALGSLSNPDFRSQLQSSGGRQFSNHHSGGTQAGTTNGPVSWSVDWTSPSAGFGKAIVYGSGNATNGNSSPTLDFIYNYALPGLESGATAEAAGAVTVDFPLDGSAELSRTSHRLVAKIHVRNTSGVTDTFAVATRVELPNGNKFPQSGFITIDQLTLAPGETGVVSFDKNIKNSAPTGAYKFEALIGFAPSTLIATESIDFLMLP